MDVRFIIALFSMLLITACGSRGVAPEDPTNKAVDACTEQQMADQKIIRWKNGKITRHNLKQISPLKFQNLIEKNKNQISFIENDFKIKRPSSPGVSLFSWRTLPNWGVDAIYAPALWRKNILGQNVLIAVIDSGIDTQHPQLQNQLYINPKETLNGLDDDKNGLIDDIHGYDFSKKTGTLSDSTGHGTHVTGIIAADPGAGDIKGVAPLSKVVVYDFFTDEGDGSVFDAISAIRAAENAGAKIINASWGGASCSLALREMIDDLAQKNILFVTAAGNENLNIDRQPAYPAAYTSETLISVGAMTVDRLTAGFSNYGQRVHLVAPGVDILSTFPGPELFAMESGTSMAAPFVAGAAALLWSAFPTATAQQIKQALLSSTQQGPFPVVTRGALDVWAAHQFLSQR